jgi:integrase
MKVDPFTNKKDIRNIKKLLQNNPRDLLLFVIGVNSGLRVQDILSLRVGDLAGRKVGDRIGVREKKTSKENVFVVNKEILDTFKKYMATLEPEEEHFLIKSRKGFNYPLTTYRVTCLVKEWAAALNIRGNFGAHSLRKTFCYVQRVYYGTSWEVLSKRLNHSSPSITRRYIGVKEEEVETMLLNTI